MPRSSLLHRLYWTTGCTLEWAACWRGPTKESGSWGGGRQRGWGGRRKHRATARVMSIGVNEQTLSPDSLTPPPCPMLMMSSTIDSEGAMPQGFRQEGWSFFPRTGWWWRQQGQRRGRRKTLALRDGGQGRRTSAGVVVRSAGRC